MSNPHAKILTPEKKIFYSELIEKIRDILKWKKQRSGELGL